MKKLEDKKNVIYSYNGGDACGMILKSRFEYDNENHLIYTAVFISHWYIQQ